MTHALIERLRDEKREFFELSRTENIGENEILTKASSVARLQSEIDIATLRHFQSIRAMCMPQQRLKFDCIMNEVLRMLGAPPPAQ